MGVKIDDDSMIQSFVLVFDNFLNFKCSFCLVTLLCSALNLLVCVCTVCNLCLSNNPLCRLNYLQHSTEVHLITKYSPFQSEQSLFEQFDKIKGPTGTMVIVYNLSTTPNGELELDFTSDPLDIKASIQLDNDA